MPFLGRIPDPRDEDFFARGVMLLKHRGLDIDWNPEGVYPEDCSQWARMGYMMRKEAHEAPFSDAVKAVLRAERNSTISCTLGIPLSVLPSIHTASIRNGVGVFTMSQFEGENTDGGLLFAIYDTAHEDFGKTYSLYRGDVFLYRADRAETLQPGQVVLLLEFLREVSKLNPNIALSDQEASPSLRAINGDDATVASLLTAESFASWFQDALERKRLEDAELWERTNLPVPMTRGTEGHILAGTRRPALVMIEHDNVAFEPRVARNLH